MRTGAHQFEICVPDLVLCSPTLAFSDGAGNSLLLSLQHVYALRQPAGLFVNLL